MAARGLILQKGKEALKAAGIADYQSDSWLLYEAVSGGGRAHFLLERQQDMPEEERTAYEALIQKRCRRIPLQHILGTQDFMGYSFCVDEHVLIPRMDTEILVLELEKHMEGRERVLDMCTGSGCIAVSLKKRNPGLQVSAADISEKALSTAEKNSRRLDAGIQFYQSDLFEVFKQSEIFPQKPQFDIIAANPPYIPTGEIEELEEEVRVHEPRLALDGREDGLEFYRRITGECRQFLSSKGMLFYEIGHDQGEAVSELMEQEGFCGITIVKDLAGLDRVVYGGVKHV